MAKKEDDFGVFISMRRFLELVELSGQVKELRQDNAKLKDQILALRVVQQQCIEKLGELEKLL